MRPKLAFVTNPLDANFRSSISIITLELAKRLSGDFDITVYTSAAKGAVDPEGVKVRRLHVWPDRQLRRLTGRLARFYGLKKPFFTSALYYPSYMFQLGHDMRKQGFDIAHIHNFSQFVPYIRSLNRNTRFVLHTHSEWLSQLDGRMMGGRVAAADLVLCCSDFITARTRQGFPDYASRCHTLHNGVDYGRFSQVSPARTGSRLICVGRITPEKGLHTLIEAFNIVAPKHPDLELHFIGQERITPREFLVDLSETDTVRSLASFYPGSYQKKITERIDPQLSSRVVFTGHVSHSEMMSRYSEANIFINASFYESFGMPVAEAMACGLPVIATRVGGVPEIVEDGRSGLLIQPGDARSLAKSIELLLMDRKLCESFSEEGRERVRDHFSWDGISETLASYYREITVR